MTVCPICNGKGKRIHIKPHPRTKVPITYIEWCLCTKSMAVSDSSYNPILSFLNEQYMPLNKIDKQLKFDPFNLRSNPFLFIYNTSYNDFCYHLKSVVMKYRFAKPSPLIYCCTSIDLLHKFYVAQEDGSCQHLSGTDKFDLMVVTLGTKEKNNQLNTCVAQVIYNRICSAKPIWLYCPFTVQGGIGGPADLNTLLNLCMYEHSKDLEEYVWNEFKRIILTPTKMQPRKIQTKTEKMGANFKRKQVNESKPKK